MVSKEPVHKLESAHAHCRVHAIRVERFRNLGDLFLEPAEGLNVLEGLNGQGKTNFLECLVLLSGLRSFRGARFNQMVASGAEDFLIEGRFTGSDGQEHVVQQYWKGRGKKIRLDDKPIRKQSDILKLFPIVFFGPDDLEISKGSPSHRRTFMDEGMVLLAPPQMDQLRTFQETLRQRNKVLKDVREGVGDTRLLKVYTRSLLASSELVQAARKSFIESFRGVYARTIDEMTEGTHTGDVELVSSDIGEGTDSSDRESDAFVDAIIKRDLARGTTAHGPHRSDLRLFLDGHDIQGWASQGQNRLVVIGLKIALLRMVSDERSCEPILLLDDVSSELDAYRSRMLSTHLCGQGGQVFATTTDANPVGFNGPEILKLKVDSGRIVAVLDGEAG
tara:strand:+ start:2182 stop:3354 length:1173 start_codon:yes stop_codon:yes gene_type:complete